MRLIKRIKNFFKTRKYNATIYSIKPGFSKPKEVCTHSCKLVVNGNNTVTCPDCDEVFTMFTMEK